jgi:hypothetical protein
MKFSPKSNYPALEIDQCKHSTGDLLTLDPCSRFQYIFLCLRILQRVILHAANTVLRRHNNRLLYESIQEEFCSPEPQHLDLVTGIKLFKMPKTWTLKPHC